MVVIGITAFVLLMVAIGSMELYHSGHRASTVIKHDSDMQGPSGL